MSPYGSLTAAAIGSLMKELVRRVIGEIRSQRFTFEARAKQGSSGQMDDLVTTADAAAQELYVKLLREWFPGFGIIAEENKLRLPCTLPGVDLYFTVDPLDGTKAFGRRESTGVGTMISLVMDGRVIAAYVGDVMTQDIYGFRPESAKVHHVTGFDHAVPLGPDLAIPISRQYVVLRDPLDEHSSAMQELVHSGKFKSHEIGGGSIGIMMARLWRGVVGGVVLTSNQETPWDFNPIFGISDQLGFGFYQLSDGKPVPVPLQPLKEVMHRSGELLVIHKSFAKNW